LARVVTRSTTNTTSALNLHHWLPIQQQIDFKLATLVHRSLHNAGPQYLSSLLHPYTPSRQLRSDSLNLLSQPRINITLASRGFRHAGPSLWKSFPNHLRSTDSYTVFKSNLKTHHFLWCKHLWPLAISVPALLIRHSHVDFCVLKLYYVIMLCYESSESAKCSNVQSVIINIDELLSKREKEIQDGGFYAANCLSSPYGIAAS